MEESTPPADEQSAGENSKSKKADSSEKRNWLIVI
jgi:hypothetical protein